MLDREKALWVALKVAGETVLIEELTGSGFYDEQSGRVLPKHSITEKQGNEVIG